MSKPGLKRAPASAISPQTFRRQDRKGKHECIEKYPRISPYLWFDSNAEAAVNFYLSVFKDSRLLDDVEAGDGSANGPRTIAFELEGQTFTAINGGPYFKFTEAVSFVVRCDNQQEIDDDWAKFTENGTEGQCGWLKDKFGLSW